MEPIPKRQPKPRHVDITVRATFHRDLFKRIAHQIGNVRNPGRGQTDEAPDFYDYIADHIEQAIPTDTNMQAAVITTALLTGSAEIIRVSKPKGSKGIKMNPRRYI